MLTNAKINYNLNYVSGAGIAYKQCLKITQSDFDYIMSKIKKELELIEVLQIITVTKKCFLSIQKRVNTQIKNFIII